MVNIIKFQQLHDLRSILGRKTHTHPITHLVKIRQIETKIRYRAKIRYECYLILT